MTRGVLLLIFGSVLMSALAQIMLKAGMRSPSVSEALAAGDRWPAVAAVATNPWVLLGLTVYFLSAIVWLLVLARVEVSMAYPFVGLGFIATMLLGYWIYGDALSCGRVVGTLLIASGVVVMALRG